MRHRKARYKLGIKTAHRQAMLRNMVTSLFKHESIVTTDAKAKALRSLADKMITLGKRGDLHSRRLALRVIRSKEIARRLFEDIAPRFADRQGGYVRVIKKGLRVGDRSPMSVVELVEKAPEVRASKMTDKSKKIKDRIVDTLTKKE